MKRIDWQRLTYQLLAVVRVLALVVAAVVVKRGTLTFKLKLPQMRRSSKRTA